MAQTLFSRLIKSDQSKHNIISKKLISYEASGTQENYSVKRMKCGSDFILETQQSSKKQKQDSQP